MDNRKIYSSYELQSWLNREHLIKVEEYLIKKYISNHGTLIEAGCGNGRISCNIKKIFPKLDIIGFDFVEEMVKTARKRCKNIKFYCLDATDLSKFKDESFDYAIYLQQIISLIPYDRISTALDESYRILKKDGIVIFSFLNYHNRKINYLLSAILMVFRFFRGEKLKYKQLPWLKLSGKINYNFLSKNQALNYWFSKNEIIQLLQNKGFSILEVYNKGMLYIVCKK